MSKRAEQKECPKLAQYDCKSCLHSILRLSSITCESDFFLPRKDNLLEVSLDTFSESHQHLRIRYFSLMTSASTNTTSLQDLNKEFREQYTKARDALWQSVTKNGSVIIARGSSLNLIDHVLSTVVAKAIPQVYHDL